MVVVVVVGVVLHVTVTCGHLGQLVSPGVTVLEV